MSNGIVILLCTLMISLPSCFTKQPISDSSQTQKKKVTQAWTTKSPSDHLHFVVRSEIWDSWWPWHCTATQGTSWALSLLQQNYRLSSSDLTLSYRGYNWPLFLAQLPLQQPPYCHPTPHPWLKSKQGHLKPHLLNLQTQRSLPATSND